MILMMMMRLMIIMMLKEQWFYSTINRTGDEEAQRLIVDSRGRRTGINQGVHFVLLLVMNSGDIPS